MTDQRSPDADQDPYVFWRSVADERLKTIRNFQAKVAVLDSELTKLREDPRPDAERRIEQLEATHSDLRRRLKKRDETIRHLRNRINRLEDGRVLECTPREARYRDKIDELRRQLDEEKAKGGAVLGGDMLPEVVSLDREKRDLEDRCMGLEATVAHEKAINKTLSRNLELCRQDQETVNAAKAFYLAFDKLRRLDSGSEST